MKVKFETCHRALLGLLLLTLFWSVWSAMAQTTNSNAAPAQVSGGTTNREPLLNGAGKPPQEIQVTPVWAENWAVEFPVLKTVWLGNELWKYLASFVYILLAFYVSKFLDFLTRVWLRRWAARTETRFDDLVLELLNGPVKVVAFVILLHIGLGVFRWPDRVQVILSRGFTILVAATLTYMLLKFIDLLMTLWRKRALAHGEGAIDEQLFPVVRKSVKTFVIVVAVLVTAQNLEINVTAAITSLSIGGLAIGLAAQDTLANLFGAVAVFIDRPFRLGDAIRLDAVEGVVEAIGLRSLRVRNAKGYLVTIPNKAVGNATIINISKRPVIQTELNLNLAVDTTAEKLQRALAILQEVYSRHELTRDLIISFNKFQDTGLNILVVYSTAVVPDKAHFAALQTLNLETKARFDAEGIQFAAPARTVLMKPA